MLAEGMGNVQCGWKDWWSPLVCCQRKARADCSSAADSSSFQTEIGLLVGKAPPGITVCKMDCSEHLVELPPASFLSPEPLGAQHHSSVSRDICKASRTHPLQVHLLQLLSSSLNTLNARARARAAHTLHVCLPALSNTALKLWEHYIKKKRQNKK